MGDMARQPRSASTANGVSRRHDSRRSALDRQGKTAASVSRTQSGKVFPGQQRERKACRQRLYLQFQGSGARLPQHKPCILRQGYVPRARLHDALLDPLGNLPHQRP
jgi:hypothetical protein